ncbi:MAG TPA: oligosaccharide flippase family protein [Nitrospirales bacterium]
MVDVNLKPTRRSTARLLASGSALRAANLAAQIVVAFFLTPFVIHCLGDRMYGLWALVGTFIGYYGLLDLGLGNAVSRYIARALGKGEREECGRVFSAALQLYVTLGAVVTAVTVVLAFLSPLFAQSPQDAALFWKVILILGFSVALSFPVNVYGGLLSAELRMDSVALTEILTLLLRTGLVVAVLMGGGKILALAWVSFLSGVPRMAAYVALSRRQCPWLRFCVQPWFGQWTKTLLFYGAFALVAQVSDQLRFNADALVITAFVGLAAVTHFRIAALMVSCFMNLMIGLVGTIQPWFSRMDGVGDYRAIKTRFLFAIKLSMCVAGFVGFGFVFWGKPFIQRWMGPFYLDAYPCLVVLTLGYIAALGQSPSTILLYAISKHKFFALMNLAEGIANLVLSVWLVKPLGIFGVALGTFIPMLLTKLIVQPLYVCRVSFVPYGEYMREIARSLVVIGVALLVPGLISARFAAANYYSLMAVALSSLVCYLPVIWFLHLTKQERAIVGGAVLPSRAVRGHHPVLSAGEAS